MNENNKGYNFDPKTGELINPDYKGYEAAINDKETESNEDQFIEQEVDKAEVNEEEHYETYNTNSDTPEPEYAKPKQVKVEKNKKERKASSVWKKIGLSAAIAAVFGIVSGSIFAGMNVAGRVLGNKIESAAYSVPETSIDIAPPEIEEVLPYDQIFDENEINSSYYSSSGETGKGYIADVTAACMPSVVTIASVSVVEMQNFFGQKTSYEAQGAGSGVIVGQNDTELLIATNNHVVEGAKSLTVGFVDESSVEASIKGTDRNNDLAVVAVKLENISPETLAAIKIATLGDSSQLVLGEEVIAIGNALGIGQSVTDGIVSALNRHLTFQDGNTTIDSTELIQTSAPINSGNSGGGLFNIKGELIGINEAKSSTSSSGVTVDGVGYAISINKAKPILEGLMALVTRDRVDAENQGYLGVTCADVTADIANTYNMPIGVCFTKVLPDSPASEAGIIKGDILVSFDGRPITLYQELKETLTYYSAGEVVNVTIMRADETGEYVEMELPIVLGTYEAISSIQSN